MSLVSFLATVCLLIGVTSAQTTIQTATNISSGEDSKIYFDPKDLIGIKERNTVVVNWYTTLPGANGVFYTADDEGISKIVNWTQTFDEDFSRKNTGYGSFTIETIFLGLSSFNVTIVDENNNTLGSAKIFGTVLLPYQKFNLIFTYTMLFLTFVAYINMGATLDLQVVLKTIKRPIGPAVGLISQYSIMPLASYGLAHIFVGHDPLMMLGMFLIGSSPGGGLSNIWTYLFDGSLDLSVTMTLVSTIFAFAAVPLWVFSLGPTIFSDTDFEIPFVNIVILLVMLIVPCGIGILIQLYLPRVAKFIQKHVLKKISLFNAVFALTVGGYAYRYVFSMFTMTILLASFLLPVCGYLCGFLIATAVGRPKDEKIAIVIETGVQNAQIPILILKLSLGSPIGDLAIVVPAAIVILTPLTLLIVYILKSWFLRFFKGEKAEITSDKKLDISNGKTNESFDDHTSDKNAFRVVPMERNNQNHSNPGFLPDSTYSHSVYPNIPDAHNGNKTIAVQNRDSRGEGNAEHDTIYYNTDKSNDTVNGKEMHIHYTTKPQ